MFQIEHSYHRNSISFTVNLLVGLIVYSLSTKETEHQDDSV
ncbi:hypothetical protein [Candidatus Enterovibrio escicola]|nr:hypothetical protein [Candidatus Enterovibrio escacola]